MPFLTEAQARAAGERATIRKTASAVIRESNSRTHFDVFLSHSILDQVVVLGAKQYLEEAGVTVYVDWDVDAQLDRTKVDRDTAAALRKRMGQCDSLLYLWSRNAAQSKWMPWELGYFDALKGNVGVMPLVSRPDDVYAGSEYVLLYPTVDITAVAGKLIATVGGVPIRSWISPGYKPGFLRST